MSHKKCSHSPSVAVLSIVTMTVLVFAASAAAQKETVLLNFETTNLTGGVFPIGGLIFDAEGNLYGTTSIGGTYRDGTVFELALNAQGAWTEKVLHSFKYDNGKDGSGPVGNLVMDKDGNLYGITISGGSVSSCFTGPCGVVFELTPAAGGNWNEKILHNFGQGKDGFDPVAGLVLDSAGNLYGTTQFGGNGPCLGSFAVVGCGVVFELSPAADGSWTEKILHDFQGPDGFGPQAGLVLDAQGNLYGTTFYGGHNPICYRGGGFGCGNVFELTPKVGGQWIENVLHEFGIGNDGTLPEGNLVFDSSGNLYGTTLRGGVNGSGTVFELSPRTGGGWTEKVLHDFNQNGSDGYNVYAGVTLDVYGNLYGTTALGGTGAGCDGNGCGTAFELKPAASGAWVEYILYEFSLNQGTNPPSGLILDSYGNLYGVTEFGGTSLCTFGTKTVVGCGTVFEITP
jgi:uncharacterized repeat protein (TIGR03803 family)